MAKDNEIIIKGKFKSRGDELMLEYGKNAFLKTNNVLRDFCKFMITFTVGAIPVFLGILGLVISTDDILSATQIAFIYIPFVIFIASSIIFLVGYFPKFQKLPLDDVLKIEEHRETIYNKRKLLIILGLSLFLLGIIIIIVSSYWFLI